MKLKTKGEVQVIEAIVTGELWSLKQNIPLAKMLDKIDKDGVLAFYQDESVKKFANGLINSFRQDGLMNGDSLTQEGKTVVETEKAWKILKGQFKILVAFKDRYQYIVDCYPCTEVDVTGFKNQNLPIKFIGEYKNNFDVDIKKVVFDPTWYVSESKTIEMDSCYDYLNDKNVYEIIYNDKKYVFDENEYTFKLFDSHNAIDLLVSAMSTYKDFKVERSSVKLYNYDNNPLLLPVITEIFEKGSFDVRVSEYAIEDIKISIENESVVKALLLEYLLRKAEERYLGYEEIRNLITSFYALFEKCISVSDSTERIYTQLLELSKSRKSTAYLRLLAYKDLMPDMLFRSYEIDTRDFSNQRMSMDDIVREMFSDIKEIKSVKMATQYACKNISISRNARLFAESLKNNYNVPLTFITCNDESANETAKDFFNRLKHDRNVKFILVGKEEISKKIHDRYILVEKGDGEKVWFKMSGELDAVRYDANDKVTKDAIAYIKEMTVYKVSDDGIIDDVKSLMENK